MNPPKVIPNNAPKKKKEKQKTKVKANNNAQKAKMMKQRIPVRASVAPPQRPAQGLFSTIGQALGSAGGSLFGAPGIGGAVGSHAGEWIAHITGFGDYKVRQNTIQMGQASASFMNNGDGVEICHREFLTDIVGSTGFNINSLSINPGLASTFPWLSQLACYFEQYEVMGMIFEYVPSSGTTTNVSPALGVVIFATEYDVYDSTFNSKQAMESYQFSSSTVPFAGMVHAIECARDTKPMVKQFTRSSPVPAGALLNYDLGTFYYATQGMSSAYTCGELWITYHIRLSKPKINTSCPPRLVTWQYTTSSPELPHLNSVSFPVTGLSTFNGQIASAATAAVWNNLPSIYLNGYTAGTFTNQIIYMDPNTSQDTLVIPAPGQYLLTRTVVPINSSYSIYVPGVTATYFGVTPTYGTNITVLHEVDSPGNVSQQGSATTIIVGEMTTSVQFTVNVAGLGSANMISWPFNTPGAVGYASIVVTHTLTQVGNVSQELV